MSDFLFPDVGEGITEGKLVSWKITEGTNVKQDQVLCEVETDKAVVEIPSPHPGIITKLHHAVGAVIKVGQPLVTFDDNASSGAASSAAPEFKRPIESGTKKVESNLVPALPTELGHAPAITSPILTPAASLIAHTPHHVLAAPSTRRLARERGVDIERVQGSGPSGRVSDADVLAAASDTAQTVTQTAAPTPQQAVSQPTIAPAPIVQSVSATAATQVKPQVIPGASVSYSGRRKLIGEHMLQSATAPTVTEFAQADVTNLMDVRDRLKVAAEQDGIKLTPLAFVAKAVTIALKKHPVLNSILAGDEIRVISDINLGIAMDAPKGLVVPVIPNADRMSIAAIAKSIQTLADSARTDTLTLQQVRGSTFSITSIGPLRVQGFTPILNAPESAILGVGAIQDIPWVVHGMIVARKVVTLSLTFDHRVFDGAEAARFITNLVSILEEPDRLLLGSV